MKINKSSNYLKINLLIIMSSILIIISITVGYSVLTKKLGINKTVLVKGVKDIRINGMLDQTSINGGYEINKIKYTSNIISSSIGLANINSSITYNFTIKNYGTIPMKIDSIKSTINDNADIIFIIEGIDTDTIFLNNEEKSFSLTFKYNPSLIEVPISTIINFIIEINFVEYINEPSYIKDGMLLDFRGTDKPVNNIWYDRVSKESMTLYDVTHNSTLKMYSYKESSYSTLNKPTIPATGDFTLEARIVYPSDITTNTDQAIVSQVSDTSNDTGRFKLNASYANSLKRLLIFYNDISANTNKFVYFTTSSIDSQIYLAQIVRTDNEFKLYLNGTYITSEPFDKSATISQRPLKIGKWNTLLQSFHGSIYSLRLYNRALNEKELLNNKMVDDIKYNRIDDNLKTIKEYALTYHTENLYLNNIDNYVYRGTNPSNYVKFEGDNKMYRIISFNPDDTMKIIDIGR